MRIECGPTVAKQRDAPTPQCRKSADAISREVTEERKLKSNGLQRRDGEDAQ